MYLVQILLPVYDNQGNSFSKKKFEFVRKLLTEKFGRLTSYLRAPAQGFWKDEKDEVVKDDIILFEVIQDKIDYYWWNTYKNKLKDDFCQDEIIIRSTKIELI